MRDASLKKIKMRKKSRRDEVLKETRGDRRDVGERECQGRDRGKRANVGRVEELGRKLWTHLLDQWLHLKHKDCQIHFGDVSAKLDFSHDAVPRLLGCFKDSVWRSAWQLRGR